MLRTSLKLFAILAVLALFLIPLALCAQSVGL